MALRPIADYTVVPGAGPREEGATNGYAWYDGAVQQSTSHDSDTGSGSNPIWTTSYTLNAYGQLTSAHIADGKTRDVSYTNDELGQIIRRDESGAIAGQTGNPHEVWYRNGGRTLGQTGNNGSTDVDYASSIAQRTATPPATSGTFAHGGTYATPSADFAQSLSSINSFGQGSAGGAYTVRAGDTLGSIALAEEGVKVTIACEGRADGDPHIICAREMRARARPEPVPRLRHQAAPAPG